MHDFIIRKSTVYEVRLKSTLDHPAMAWGGGRSEGCFPALLHCWIFIFLVCVFTFPFLHSFSVTVANSISVHWIFI